MCPWRGMGEKSTGIKFQCNCLLNCGLQILKFYPWFCVTTAVMNSAWLRLARQCSLALSLRVKNLQEENDENHAGLPAKLTVSPRVWLLPQKTLGSWGPWNICEPVLFLLSPSYTIPFPSTNLCRGFPWTGSQSSWWCFIRPKRARQPQQVGL